MFKKLGRQNLTELIVGELKAYIYKNGLKPGNRLPTERELATVFGTSRVPVREAIKSLQMLGVVSVKRRKGIVLTNFDLSSTTNHLHFKFLADTVRMKEVAEARFILELSVIPLTIERARKEDFDKLEEIIEKMEDKLLRKDYEGFLDADLLFHETMLSASKNSILIHLHDVIQNFIQMLKENIGIIDPKKESELHMKLHRELIESLRLKDKEGAEEKLRELWRSLNNSISQQEDSNFGKEVEFDKI